MRYLGSKRRLARHILPVVLKDRREDQWYVEPFAGGFNIIDKVKGKRIANDNNKYLMSLYKAVKNGWIPPDTVTREEYAQIKENKDSYPEYLVGFVGFGCSFGGKWFGGYAQTSDGRNYARESRDNILKQNIDGIIIKNTGYLYLDIPENSIIYCDPPYQGTTKYKDDFDHGVFWDWARAMSISNTVFVSEYRAPKDFSCVLEIPLSCKVAVNESAVKVERLFKYEHAG